jgi:hypothetical protein
MVTTMEKLSRSHLLLLDVSWKNLDIFSLKSPADLVLEPIGRTRKLKKNKPIGISKFRLTLLLLLSFLSVSPLPPLLTKQTKCCVEEREGVSKRERERRRAWLRDRVI